MKISTVDQLRREAPIGLVGCNGFDDAKTPFDVVFAAQLTMDLIEEGQEEADHWTPSQCLQLKKFLSKYQHIVKGALE